MTSTAPNKDLKDMDVLCIFKSKIKPKFRSLVYKTSDHIQIKIKMPNPSQELPVTSKAPNGDLKDMHVLCTFETEIESQKF